MKETLIFLLLSEKGKIRFRLKISRSELVVERLYGPRSSPPAQWQVTLARLLQGLPTLVRIKPPQNGGRRLHFRPQKLESLVNLAAPAVVVHPEHLLLFCSFQLHYSITLLQSLSLRNLRCYIGHNIIKLSPCSPSEFAFLS